MPAKEARRHGQGHRNQELRDESGEFLTMNPNGNLSYDVFVNNPPPQDGFLPNGEPKQFSPMASTLI